jgi:hypothetical protein
MNGGIWRGHGSSIGSWSWTSGQAPQGPPPARFGEVSRAPALPEPTASTSRSTDACSGSVDVQLLDNR